MVLKKLILSAKDPPSVLDKRLMINLSVDLRIINVLGFRCSFDKGFDILQNLLLR